MDLLATFLLGSLVALILGTKAEASGLSAEPAQLEAALDEHTGPQEQPNGTDLHWPGLGVVLPDPDL